MKLPTVTHLQLRDTHRLIPSKHSGGGVLSRIADNESHLKDIFDLDHATNNRLLAENDLLPGIGVDELISGMPFHSIVNASFTHASPEGSRFNGPDRGAWYAGCELATSQAEILFHKSKHYMEISWSHPDETSYDDYLANFDADFHDIRGDAAFAACLDPDSYYASQALAAELLRSGSIGVVYPSVRTIGTCLASFRPAAVVNIRKAGTYIFRWQGLDEPPYWS
ncbi:MAG: RES family NAD+ phosphorylase [Acidobacteriota bacterium]